MHLLLTTVNYQCKNSNAKHISLIVETEVEKKMARQTNCSCQFVCNSKVDNLSMIINFYNKWKTPNGKNGFFICSTAKLVGLGVLVSAHASFALNSSQQQQQQRRTTTTWLWLRDINHFISVAGDCICLTWCLNIWNIILFIIEYRERETKRVK